MQPGQSSKTIQGSQKVSATRGKQASSANQQSSRNRNTSGGDSGGATGRTLIFCDGKNVTPKSLVPAAQQKDVKADGPDELGAATKEGGHQTLGDEGRISAPGDDGVAAAAAPLVPVPDKAKPVKQAGLTKDELERNVDIILTETETDTLLNFKSLCVALDNVEKSQAVSARNKAYDDLCHGKADSDQYREQHAQTLNHPHKSKEVLAAPPSQESVEVNANRWDIWDTITTDPVPKHEQIQQACERESAATVAQAIKKPGCLFNMNEPYPTVDSPKEATSGKVKPGAKSGAGGKSGAGLGAGPSAAGSGGLGSAASKSLAPGQTSDGLAAPASGQVASNTGAGGAGGEDRDGSGSPVPRGDSTSPGPDGAGAASGQEEDAADKQEKALEPVDPIPWKVGMHNPIPEELSQALRTMERIVSQNVFHKQHMIYRNYPTLEELARLDAERADEANGVLDGGGLDGSSGGRRSTVRVGDGAEGGEMVEDEEITALGETTRDESSSDKPSLQDLFCFDAPQLTQGLTVTCAEWNRHNQDLLAVSYGDTAPVPSVPGGLVLFWSLKNPTYPERVIRTKHGVTALHFSSVHPNMVAAGSHDGSVMIWDLRRPTDVPVLRSGNDQVKKHTDIVWETRWVDRGPDKQPPELLVSVSSDGNVFQWSMKKGLEQTVLMQLKRLPNQHLGSNSVYGHKEGIVFRKSSGFCVDFPRHDPSTYLVGTEDGLVHRCSTSYNEQYLDTYYGHSGPVYRVRCNPYASHAFLTCSADWTMKLWTTKPPVGHSADQALLHFQSTDLSDAVNDVIWAPHNSTSFAAAMDDGRVELWDLSERPLDPIVVHYPRASQPRRRRTCVRFSPNSPVLIAGDDQGSVDVMRMYNTNQSYYSDQEQQDRLNTVMTKKR